MASGQLGLFLVLVQVVAAAALWPAGGTILPAERRPGASPHQRPLAGGQVAGAGVIRSEGDGAREGDGSREAEPAGRWGRQSRAGPRWRAAARRRSFDRALAELMAALVAPLRAGVPPAVAIAAATPVFGHDPALRPLLLDLADAAGRGDPVAEVWLEHARIHGSSDLSFVGRAWALSELCGAPLVDALASGEQVLRARARARRRWSAAAAGPRASMAVLCLLPASGPVVGTAMGVGPMTLYFSSPVATGSLVLGIGLGLGAWLWSRRILRAAT